MHEISIRAEELFRIGNFPVTNSLLLTMLAAAALIGLGFVLKRGARMVPGKLQSVFELLFEEMLKLMDSVLGSRRLSEKYLPFVATIFLFIMTSNWLGLVPLPFGLKGAGEHGEEVFLPLFRAPASDLNFTVALAIISVVATNALAIAAVGLKGHASKFFNFSSPLLFFTGILELISEFVKIVSFSFRLFGNVFAGEVLLAIVGFLAPYALPLPFLFLEVFVGFIQAFIFAMLTLVAISMATSHETAH